jgi:hypothetical protein
MNTSNEVGTLEPHFTYCHEQDETRLNGDMTRQDQDEGTGGISVYLSRFEGPRQRLDESQRSCCLLVIACLDANGKRGKYHSHWEDLMYCRCNSLSFHSKVMNPE